jgi:1-pyrroline-5-carboxylate dehydrogenase
LRFADDGAIGPRYQAINEPVLQYAPGSPEREALQAELKVHASRRVEIPLVVGGREMHTRSGFDLTAPHDHRLGLARASSAGVEETRSAIEAATRAYREWSCWSLQERSAVFLKAADLLCGPWRQRLNAATMLGQSKTAYQAEIDSACELADFFRFNVQFAQEIAQQQPLSSAGVRNRIDHRPLEGFVFAVTPFNFTAIGGNLATAPALMGNTVVWKPAGTAVLSNYLVMQLLQEAGLPPGVINFVPGEAAAVASTVLADMRFAGLHFTGSTAVFDQLWQETARNLAKYRNYPRLVGETGGKDFVLAHPSADLEALAVALVRGAFEYQGQKCSAASRAYVPQSLWPRLRDRLVDRVGDIAMGDVADLANFMGAVIDRRAFERITGRIEAARRDAQARILVGGKFDDRVGYFIEPTIVELDDPSHGLMRDELFGPVLGLYVYEDARWPEVLRLVDETSGYGLTGAVFAQDRQVMAEAHEALRYAAGNFYVNDKPTGAVVGQQPFGGARRSGTNDKAGSALNLLRWVSPRTVKETHVPARDHGYAHMA